MNLSRRNMLKAGAAALAAQKNLTPRAVPVKEIQKLLLKQGAYLG